MGKFTWQNIICTLPNPTFEKQFKTFSTTPKHNIFSYPESKRGRIPVKALCNIHTAGYK